MQANPKKGSTRLPFIYFVILFLYQHAICKSLQHDKRTRLLHGKHDLDNASLFSNRQLIVDVRGIFQSELTPFLWTHYNCCTDTTGGVSKSSSKGKNGQFPAVAV
ncbi:MAG: hypothetical protein ACJAS1_007270 [Oleiphilaceae bacterium]|jgi:hypothetical protein